MIVEKRIYRLAKTILRRLDKSDHAFDIFLLPHAEIKKLKARFIKKQTEPNVLAFPEPRAFPHPEHSGRGRKKYLGEIYLNKDILRKSPERAAPLLLHGTLHLLGYDHEKIKDRSRMEKIENEILRAFSK